MDTPDKDRVRGVVEAFQTTGRTQLSLDELAEIADRESFGYGAVEMLLDAFEAAGVAVDTGRESAPESVTEPDPLLLQRILKAARALKAELERGPTSAEIAERMGVEEALVRKVLRQGAAVGS